MQQSMASAIMIQQSINKLTGHKCYLRPSSKLSRPESHRDFAFSLNQHASVTGGQEVNSNFYG